MREAPRQLRGSDSADRNTRPAPERLPAVIRNVADVERLLNWTRGARRLPRAELVVAVPGLAEDERAVVQAALNKSIRACGCAAAGSACLIAIGALAAYLLATASGRTWLDLAGVIAAGLVAVTLVTAIAKWLGLYAARLRFRRSCHMLLRSISEERFAEPQNKERGDDVQTMGRPGSYRL